MSKLLTNYIENFIMSCPGSSKDEILSEFKDNKKKFQEFLTENKIKIPKQKKNENEPKKAKTSYIIFCEIMRPKITANKDNDIISVLAEKWGEVKKNPTELAKYEKLALQDKERYESEIKKYRIDNNIPEKVQVEKQKTAFYFYKKDNYETFSSDKSLSKKEILKKLQEQWSGLKNEKSEIFNRYSEMAKAAKNNTAVESDEVPKVEEKKEKKKSKKDKDETVTEGKKEKKSDKGEPVVEVKPVETKKDDKTKEKKKKMKVVKKPIPPVFNDDDNLEEEA